VEWGGRILKRDLVVYEHRVTGERLSLTYLQTERCEECVHLALSAGVTSRDAAV
jgi:hypothetical protein